MSQKRVLVLNSHEAWVAQLSPLPIDLDIVVGLSGRAHQGWDARMRPVPEGARLLRMNEVELSGNKYQAAVVHNVSDLLEIKDLDVPKLLVIHTTLEGRVHEEGSRITPEQLSGQTTKYLNLIRGHVLAVSELKRRSWNMKANVVGFSINLEEYPVATQQEPHGLRISNLFNLRRGILLGDFHDAAFAGIPVKFIGVNDDMPGVKAALDWSDLKRQIALARFYIHTANTKLEDGYNMATAEAMACGLPVLGNVHPSSAIEHGVSGFMSDDPLELKKYAQMLLDDRGLSRKMGVAARKRAGEFFSKDKFETGFLDALQVAKSTYWGHSAKKKVPVHKKRSKKKRR